MSKFIHVWKIRCQSCHGEFEHVFRASDILRPHIFNNLLFTCPACGAKRFDPVTPLGKFSEDEWMKEHGLNSLKDVPEYS